MLVRDGKGFGGGLMTKAMGLERPLFPAPEAGFTVITVATPGFATIAEGTTAVMEFPVTAPVLSVGTVVTKFLPFHCTTVFATKPKPVTVSVKSAHVIVVVGTQAPICAGERKDSEAPVLF
jgi:hypothetical protein